MTFDDNDASQLVDLRELALDIAPRFADEPPRGYVLGKTAIRDALMDRLLCSAVVAESLVDRMQARGFISYTGNPREAEDGDAPWTIRHEPE